MLITVFTPAYNRAHLLPKVYESLCKQTFRDFEWLIVDDGSKDDTRSVVEKFRDESLEWRDSSEVESIKNEVQNYGTTEELITLHSQTDSTLYTLRSASPLCTFRSKNSTPPPFPIRYFYQENGGKHRAINHGVREAQGELFLILDSDDYLPDNSLETIANTYMQIKGNNKFGGVAGLLKHSDGTLIGNLPPYSPIDCNAVDYWCKYKMHGDKCEIFRTNVLKEIPFPEFEGEKFCPEELTWLLISKKYIIRYIDEVLTIRDYLQGGLTSKIVKIRMESPRASIYDYSLFNTFTRIPFKQKLRNSINYWRFRFCLPKDYKKRFDIPHLKWYWNCVMPFGWLMHLNDRKRYL